MMLPKFIIIGAARCGTSSLFLNLLKHPKVKGPHIGGNKKEVHFFDTHFERGLEWYKDRFPEAEDTAYIEATPNYLYHPKVPARVKKCLPVTRFIVLLRNPVDRAWSNYWHWKDKHKWGLSILKNPKHVIVRKGIYMDQLLRWNKLFKGQILIGKSEAYFKDEKKGVKRCFKWMDLESINIENFEYWDPKREPHISKSFKDRRIKSKNSYPEMPKEIKEYLESFYRPHNQRLYEFLGTNWGWESNK